MAKKKNRAAVALATVRATKISAKRRKQIASNAALIRWAKARKWKANTDTGGSTQ